MRHYNATPPSEDTKSRLTAAFAAMRKAGLIARQNFSCCGSCAGYELATDVTKLIDAGKKRPNGIAFYHRQDTQSFNLGHDLYIAYGAVGTTKYGEIGLPTTEVGKLVLDALRHAGLEVEWDGNPDTRILVKGEKTQRDAARERERLAAEAKRTAFYSSAKEVFGL